MTKLRFSYDYLNINYTEPLYPGDPCVIHMTKDEIFLGKPDGHIDVLTSNFKAKISFESHYTTIDKLQNIGVPPGINALTTVDMGYSYPHIYALNDDTLKIWQLKRKGDSYEELQILTLPNITSYHGNSLNEKDNELLVSDMYTVKLFAVENFEQPITLVNNKQEGLTERILINKSKFIDPFTFGYCMTDGSLIVNDMRESINSRKAYEIDVSSADPDINRGAAFKSVTDFIFTDNTIAARNPGSVVYYDRRKIDEVLSRTVLNIPSDYMDREDYKALAYKKYNMDMWRDKIITGMGGSVAIVSEDTKSIVEITSVEDIYSVAAYNDNICVHHSDKLIFLVPSDD